MCLHNLCSTPSTRYCCGNHDPFMSRFAPGKLFASRGKSFPSRPPPGEFASSGFVSRHATIPNLPVFNNQGVNGQGQLRLLPEVWQADCELHQWICRELNGGSLSGGGAGSPVDSF